MNWRIYLRRPAWRDAFVVALSALLAVLVIVTGAPVVVRTPVTMWFLLTGPGLALIPLFRLDALKWVGVISGSLVVDTVVAQVMLYARIWSLATGIGAVVVVCALGLAAQARRLLPRGVDDDLTTLKGIGPQYAAALKSLGVTSYRQIADFSAADIRYFAAALGTYPGRIEREGWMQSAAAAQLELSRELVPQD